MERDYILLGIICTSAFLNFLSMIFGILSHTTGPFQHLAVNLNEKYVTQFSPESWLYPFWSSILWIWTTLIFVYVCLNIFRENKDGKMYCNPSLFTREVAALLSGSAIFQIIWFFVWDAEGLVGTAVVLFILAVCCWATLGIFTYRLWKATPFLFHHTRMDLWIFRILVQNGLGAFASWMTLEFLFKLSVALTLAYEDEAKDAYPTPSAISIIILNFIIAAAFPLEMISWEKAVRYLISPIFVVLWAMSSIYVRLGTVPHQDETVRVYSLVMLVLAVLIFLAKSASMVIRHFRNPLVPHV